MAMEEPPRGAFRLRRPEVSSTSSQQGNGHPLVLVVLLGAALAVVPTVLTYTVPGKTVRDAGEHARPVIAAILVAPLVLSMLVAVSKDWLGGKGSPLLALRQLVAVLVVVGAFVVSVGGMQQPDFLTVGGGFLLIGFAVGLGLAFTVGEHATYTDSSLAILGWGACMVILLVQIFISVAAFQPQPTTGRLGSWGLAAAMAGAVCAASFVIAIVVGFTAVPQGGIVGGWLRRGSR